MKLKGLHFVDVTEIQEAETEGPKRGIFGRFRKLYNHAKACTYMPMELLLNLKKVMCLPHVSLIFKKSCLKLFTYRVVSYWLHK
jgi:hypothetical protein